MLFRTASLRLAQGAFDAPHGTAQLQLRSSLLSAT